MSSSESDPRFYALTNATWSDLQEAERLVAADPSVVEARNSIGETAFHYLVVENASEAVEWLLQHGSQVDTRNEFGATPLMEAAKLGYVEMCRFLLEHGADVRLRDHNGDAALAHAADESEEDKDRGTLLDLLLSRLEPDEDINPLFDELSAHDVLAETGPISWTLRARGLVDPWPDDE
jgi:ankyrin repeat protein